MGQPRARRSGLPSAIISFTFKVDKPAMQGWGFCFGMFPSTFANQVISKGITCRTTPSTHRADNMLALASIQSTAFAGSFMVSSIAARDLQHPRCHPLILLSHPPNRLAATRYLPFHLRAQPVSRYACMSAVS